MLVVEATGFAVGIHVSVKRDKGIQNGFHVSGLGNRVNGNIHRNHEDKKENGLWIKVKSPVWNILIFR